MDSTHSEHDHRWLTAYLFFEGEIYDETADRVIREVVVPLVEACRRQVTRWFFLRYGEDGSHIRLRFLASDSVLDETIWPRIEEAASSSEWVERHIRTSYEPEVERYGGPQGLVLAEELFHHQSETVLALLHKIDPGTRPARLGKGLLAMLTLLFLYRGERRSAAALAQRYGTNYLKLWAPDTDQQASWQQAFQEGFDRQADRLAEYVEVAWESLESGDELTTDLDPYRQNMEEIHRRFRHLFDQGDLRLGERTADDWDECVRWIVPSYIHMMNNRLGVSIQEESYLSVLIAGTLDLPPSEEPHEDGSD